MSSRRRIWLSVLVGGVLLLSGTGQAQVKLRDLTNSLDLFLANQNSTAPGTLPFRQLVVLQPGVSYELSALAEFDFGTLNPPTSFTNRAEYNYTLALQGPFEVIPEPSTFALGGFGVATWQRWRRGSA